MMMIKIMIIMTKQIFVQRLAEPITIKRKNHHQFDQQWHQKANPKESRDPGIFTKSRPENPGIEIVDPAGAW